MSVQTEKDFDEKVVEHKARLVATTYKGKASTLKKFLHKLQDLTSF